MQPFFFSSSEKPLFGVYHPPRSGAGSGQKAVLLCYPLGQEYLRVHRAFCWLAETLSKRGMPVLRFDYYATGDSSGATGTGSVAAWTEDVAAAAQELADTSGARRLSCVALRFGCIPAVLSAPGFLPADLVLWDPVVRGSDYLRELEGLHRTKIAPLGGKAGEGIGEHAVGELVGYPFPQALRREIEQVDLATAAPRAGRTLIIAAQDAPGVDELRKRFEQEGRPVAYRRMPGAGDWATIHGRARIVHAVPAAIADWLAGKDV